MWTYEQTSGELFNAAGELVGTGYSGFDVGKNAPSWQDHHDVGPIPRGLYTIGAPFDVKIPGPHGPFVLPLEPDANNEMFGRSGFLCHGDSISHAGSASHGCIIQALPVRRAIAASGDNQLHVVEGSAIT
jgi:Protein of unknown function (DUF2778)